MPRTTGAAPTRTPPAPRSTHVAVGPFLPVAAAGSAVLLLVGCAASEPTTETAQGPAPTTTAPASPSVPAQVVADGPDLSTPTTEDIGGTEEPAPVQDAGVSILLAGLPVGGFAEVSLDDPFLRCVQVSWTGEVDLPPGVGLELIEIDLQPAGVYEPVDSGCPGDLPGCLHSPGVLESPGLCGVLVRQRGPSPDGAGSLGVVAGRVTCTSEEGWRCAEFQANLVAADDPQRIRWDDAVVERPEAETQTGDGSTDVSGTTQDG